MPHNGEPVECMWDMLADQPDLPLRKMPGTIGFMFVGSQTCDVYQDHLAVRRDPDETQGSDWVFLAFTGTRLRMATADRGRVTLAKGAGDERRHEPHLGS
jgi:hypothetical protein